MLQRVLLVNKFYYRRGGDCVVTLNTERLLREHGHEVAVFAMQYGENIATPWSRYFPSEVDFSGGLTGKLRGLDRLLGRDDVVERFTALLDDFKPDVVHLHNIHSYLSPVVARLASERGARVVWTLHDYKLVCPSYSMLRDGKVCERCVTGGAGGVLATRCMKGSVAASGIALLEAKKWNRETLERYTDAFICPSDFMRRMMLKGGYNADRLRVVCNMVDESRLTADAPHDGEYCCYVGRLSREKGVATLLQAIADEPSLQLKVAGDGPLEAELHRRFGMLPNVEFLGRLDSDAVARLMSRAMFTVMPSECYDNNPLSVIESLCAGTPVVGADIGGIPELIDDNSGITFPAGDVEQLTGAMRMARYHRWDNAAIAAAARERFSAARHYAALLDVYKAQ